MITYAWYAAKLTTVHEVFFSVNQSAFPAEVKIEKCRIQDDTHCYSAKTQKFATP
jgi:hypothetical protein